MAGVDLSLPSQDPGRLRMEFFRLGFQYYTAGRFAFAARHHRVAANLLHHAVEMMIKGHLARTATLAQLKGYGHGLPKLRAQLKESAASRVMLAGLDPVIASLHRFESIRYPGPDLDQGIDLFFAPTGDAAPTSGEDTDDSPMRLDLILGNVDRLVRTILDVAGVNPRFHTQAIPAECKVFLTRKNSYGQGY